MINYKAALFDLDGLLIDSESIARAAWSKALLDYRYELKDELFLSLIGITLQDETAKFYDEYGPEFPFDDIYLRRKFHYEQLISQNGISQKPGAFKLLEFLDRSGIKKGIATSSSRDFALQKMSKANLHHLFDTMVFGDEIKNGKPSPDIFLEVARRLNCRPCECIVLEDSEAGIMAAHAAEMIPMMVPDLQLPSSTIRSKCYHVFNSLIDVRDYLSSLLD